MDARPDRASQLQAAIQRWGTLARAATPGDAGGQLAPWVVIEPEDAATVAAVLQWADTDGLAVIPRGGGSAPTWTAAIGRVDVILSTSRLISGLDHCAGDLTAVAPAGVTIDALNAALGREGQWLPLDPPDSDRATVGGVLATNASGPRRHGYGAPRDLIIGVEMALVDGRVANAGGRVVKNVAGYDLGRLLCGSFGSLAVVTRAIFKLSPQPEASCTMVVQCATMSNAARLALTIAGSPLTPTAIEIAGPQPRLLVRFETTITATKRQALAACDICRSQNARVDLVDGDAERQLWREHAAASWPDADVLMKVSVLPTDVAGFVETLSDGVPEHSYRLAGRAALGVLLVGLVGSARRTPRDAHAAASLVARLRHWAAARGGSVVIMRAAASSQPPLPNRDASPDPGATSNADAALKTDVWGDLGSALPVMRAVKHRFDPRDTLSPGQYPWSA